MTIEADRAALDEMMATFFAAFASTGDEARFERLRELFLPSAVVVRTCGGEPTAYDVDGFIEPRRVLLAGDSLTDFSEWEISGRTEVWGDIAQRWCSYGKAGRQDGVAFEARGMKTVQFVRTTAGWRIAAASWDDEREGLVLASGTADGLDAGLDAGLDGEVAA